MTEDVTKDDVKPATAATEAAPAAAGAALEVARVETGLHCRVGCIDFEEL